MAKHKIFVMLATGLIFITQGCSSNSPDTVTQIVENADIEKIEVESLLAQDSEPSLNTAPEETKATATTESTAETLAAENKAVTPVAPTSENVAQMTSPAEVKASLRPRTTRKANAPTKTPEPASVAVIAKEANPPSSPPAELAPPLPPPGSEEVLAASEKQADFNEVVAEESVHQGLSSMILMGALGALIALFVFVIIRKRQRVQLNKNVDIFK